MRVLEADVVVVGSGVSGLLASRSLLGSGQRVVMLERGGLKTHPEQLETGTHAADVPGARPNHETAPGSREYPWSYVYGVGGSTVHWAGTSPRFHPSDFRMRSSYGVMTDWPFGATELLPFYRRAERALGIAGAPQDSSSDATGSPLPAHPLSPMDRTVAPHLAPLVALAQARPSTAFDGRPACCGAAVCELCPVDSRFSPLNGCSDVLKHPELELLTETVAARLKLAKGGRRVEAVECLDAQGEPLSARAPVTVLAAGGFENPALLLRSGLDRPDTGRYLFDHAHRTFLVRLGTDVKPGEGSALSTGISQAFQDGPFRSARSAALVIVHNPGVQVTDGVVDGLLAGRDGHAVRQGAIERWRHTLPLDVVLEDVPQAARNISLSARRDSFGLPLIRVDYSPPTEYELAGRRAVREQVERRLRPLRVREFVETPGPAGAHALGTCRIGDGDSGVVDADLRHLEVENLFVAGGSAFPTYSPAHPTLTLAALAIRLGDRLAEGA